MDISAARELLSENRLLRTKEEVGHFEQAIRSILSFQDVKNIVDLCVGFDDNTTNDEVMFGLIHAIESYDKKFGSEVSLQELAYSIPVMNPHAVEWLKILHKRILNHDSSRTVYANIISLLDIETKEILRKILNEIRDKNPKKFEISSNELLSRI